MAHIPLGPDGFVPQNMHGFDPIPKADAVDLINAFPVIATARGIDATQNSFYLSADVLTQLLQADRDTLPYEGFKVMFGVNSDKQIVLLLNRVNIVEELRSMWIYEDVPQIESVITNDDIVNTVEYASLIDGDGTITHVDRHGGLYQSYVKRFKETFGGINPTRLHRISSPYLLKKLKYDPSKPLEMKQTTLIKGFYVGWGILDLIQKEACWIKDASAGVKLFLGYGPLNLNPDSAKSLHLVAIAANTPSATVSDYPLDMVWSTQSATMRTIYLEEGNVGTSAEMPRLELNPDSVTETGIAGPGLVLRIGALGSSCTAAIQ